MINAPRRILPVVAALCLAAGTSACGSTENVKVGTGEGAYVDINDVAYQVQISRTLNPKLAEDASYLVGLPAGTVPPGPGEEWFALFLRAQNFGSSAAKLPVKFRLVDTTDKRYTPIALDTATNIFSWNPTELLEPDWIYPPASSIAGSGPVREGALLLFKLSDDVYQNRPLVLEIYDSASLKPAAVISLDL
ncbi:MAG: hypothetical protein F2799_06165 [Actinobacteria bacterium]|uniref:Unannotated protein n=1 Tax=freshwater metagenome TaxID=449393 RepID=A0A6J7E9B8_9ZZZZ|nr:hypothetical protein [Actinomycetota bacterium]